MVKKFKLLSPDDLDELKSPGWLVEDIIPENSLVQLFGREEAGKTFIALDIALRIASGLPWSGDVPREPGTTVYVAGEGYQGLAKRFRAWREYHHKTNEDLRGRFWLINEPVLLGEEAHVSGLLQSIVETTGTKKIDLLILDTQARCTVGLDENAAEDMGLAVAALDYLRHETGGSVMLLHHAPYNESQHGRGSSAMPGALDTAIYAQKDGHVITLSCKKQKDWERFEDFKMGVVSHGDSAVVIELDTLGKSPDHVELTLTPAERRILEVFRTSVPNDFGTLAADEAAKIAGVSKRSAFRAFSKLKEANLLADVGEGNYQLVPPDQSGSTSASASSATTLRGGTACHSEAQGGTGQKIIPIRRIDS